MIGECKEKAFHCPICSVELSPLEAQLLNADGCLFHSDSKPKRASVIYAMLQGLLDALIYNAKRRKALSGIDEMDLRISYHRCCVDAGALDYHNITSLRMKLRLLYEIWLIKPIPTQEAIDAKKG